MLKVKIYSEEGGEEGDGKSGLNIFKQSHKSCQTWRERWFKFTANLRHKPEEKKLR